jgi:hypothetical protein
LELSQATPDVIRKMALGLANAGVKMFTHENVQLLKAAVDLKRKLHSVVAAP